MTCHGIVEARERERAQALHACQTPARALTRTHAQAQPLCPHLRHKTCHTPHAPTSRSARTAGGTVSEPWNTYMPGGTSTTPPLLASAAFSASVNAPVLSVALSPTAP